MYDILLVRFICILVNRIFVKLLNLIKKTVMFTNNAVLLYFFNLY